MQYNASKNMAVLQCSSRSSPGFPLLLAALILFITMQVHQ